MRSDFAFLQQRKKLIISEAGLKSVLYKRDTEPDMVISNNERKEENAGWILKDSPFPRMGG
jgi:hypothetical protein